MGWFNKKSDIGTIDLTELERRGVIQRSKDIAQRKISGMRSGEVLDLTKLNAESVSSVDSGMGDSAFGFLGAIASSSESVSMPSQEISPSFSSISQGMDDTKSKLAKRLLGMTDKLEQQDKEIYTLQQRLELLERKIERIEGKG